MANPVLQYLQSRIGYAMTESPSPLARWLNGILQAAHDGSLTIEFTVREEMTNPAGILHGGAIAAIIDDVIGTTVYSLGNENYYTSVNLMIDFLESAKAGEKVIAKSNIIRQGKTIINAECEIYNESGRLLARGTSNLLNTQRKAGS
jgi:uncharacterized protein (TIGR00369 family)